MTAALPAIAVVVVAARGGERLTAALEAVTWADLSAVLGTGLAGVPPGVRVLGEPHEVATLDAQWVLLLGEEERLRPADVPRLRQAVRTAMGDEVFAVRIVATALDMGVELGRRLARLAPVGTPLIAGPSRGVEFHRTRARGRALDVVIECSRGTTLNDAMDLMAAEATALAALVHRTRGRRPGILRQPVAATLRALAGRTTGGRLGVGRWVIAMLEGYRVAVTHAKIWELERDRPEAYA